MSLPWKLLPVAAIVAVLGALFMMPGGVTHPSTASAVQDCSEDDGTSITITIFNDDENEPLSLAGAEIEITPDPYDDDGQGSPEFVDNSSADADDDPGVIVLEDICGDDNTGTHATFDVELISLPGAADDCDVDVEEVNDVEFPLDGDDVDVELVIDCDGVDLTPPTSTPSAAGTVVASASPNSVNCGGTSIVTIQVKTTAGQPVAVGTAITISASMGTVSASSGQTTDATGSAFVFYTAPNNQGGQAKVTAKAGNATGEANIQVNCAQATATTAPPPTVAPTTTGGGTITPPNTGDAGLAGTDSNVALFGVVAAIAASAIGALALVRVRAR